MSVVRPEYGPTLPELVAPRWRRLPKVSRVVAVVVLVVLAVAAFALRQSTVDPPLASVLVREPVAFTLGYDDTELRKVDPVGTESVRLVEQRGEPQRFFTGQGFALQAYRGDVSAALLGYAAQQIRAMEAADPDFAYRGEGRARVNDQPGHYVAYVTKLDGKTAYGRRFFFVPATEPGDPQPREGVSLTLVSERTVAVANVNSIENSPLKRPFRSFRFGTERP